MNKNTSTRKRARKDNFCLTLADAIHYESNGRVKGRHTQRYRVRGWGTERSGLVATELGGGAWHVEEDWGDVDVERISWDATAVEAEIRRVCGLAMRLDPPYRSAEGGYARFLHLVGRKLS